MFGVTMRSCFSSNEVGRGATPPPPPPAAVAARATAPPPRAATPPRALTPPHLDCCVICLERLDGALRVCGRCARPVHATCLAAWAAVPRDGRETRCPSCRAVWRDASDGSDEPAVDREAVEGELEVSRAVVRRRLRDVLEVSFHRSSVLRAPLAVARGGSRAPPRQYLTTQVAQALSYLERTHNVVHPCALAQRVRWQDGSWRPFLSRWERLRDASNARSARCRRLGKFVRETRLSLGPAPLRPARGPRFGRGNGARRAGRGRVRRGAGGAHPAQGPGFSAPSAAAPRATTATTPTAPSDGLLQHERYPGALAGAALNAPPGRRERVVELYRLRRRHLRLRGRPGLGARVAAGALGDRRPLEHGLLPHAALGDGRGRDGPVPERQDHLPDSDQVLQTRSSSKSPGPSGARVGARALRCRCVYARVSP